MPEHRLRPPRATRLRLFLLRTHSSTPLAGSPRRSRVGDQTGLISSDTPKDRARDSGKRPLSRASVPRRTALKPWRRGRCAARDGSCCTRAHAARYVACLDAPLLRRLLCGETAETPQGSLINFIHRAE